MSLGDHLEELRARLILAILGVAIGTILSMVFGTQILDFIKTPYVKAVKDRRSEKNSKIETPRAESESLAFVRLFFDTLTERLASDPNAPSLDPNRVAFLRDVSTQAVRAWVKEVHGAADRPLASEDLLITMSPAEGFTAYMKVSLIAGLILTAPWVFYQIWMFVAAGLYENEKKYIHTAVPFSAGLFVVGALFFLFVIARLSLNFFLAFNDMVGVASYWTLQRYISFVTVLMLVFGIAFQTPIAVYVLVRTGLVSIQTLRSTRKYVVLGLAFVAAVVTPPDVVSQISLLVPLYGLFEVGIIFARIAEKKAREQKAKESAS